MVALYFATEDIGSKTEACVYIFDYLGKVLSIGARNPFNIRKSGVFFPKGLSARVINQRGMFSISHEPNKSLEQLLPDNEFKKLIIKTDAIPKFRKVLELYGINEYAIYQDLDSLSKYLNRFVLERNIEQLVALNPEV